MRSRAAAGRADLLRALITVCGRQPPALESAEDQRCNAIAGLLCFDRLKTVSTVEGSVRSHAASSAAKIESPRAQELPPARAPLSADLFVLSEYHVHADANAAPAAGPTLQPLTAADCAPRAGGVPHAPLVPTRRLWPALQRALALPRPGPLDLAALVGTLARARLPRRLPRRQLHPWGGELLVVLDVAHHLVPYAHDYRLLFDEVQRRHGRGSLRICLVEGSPAAPLALLSGKAPARPARQVPAPPAGTPVLILGDLGLLAPGDAASQIGHAWHAWHAYLVRLAAAGARPLAWLPASRRLVPARLRRAAQVHCLDERQQSHPLAAQGAPAAVDRSALGDALAALLTRLACCVRVEPGLLRALRRLEAGAAAEPGLEALVWGNRQHVAAGERFCEIAPARVADWRERFREKLQAAEQSAVLREMLRFHAFRGRSTEAAELLIWHAHADAEARQAFAARVAQARDWFARFALRADAADGEASAYAADLLARNRGDRAWLEQHSPVLAPLWVLSGEDEVPAGLDARQVALALQAAAAQPPSPREFVLVQRDDTLALALARAAPGGSRWPLLRLAGEVVPVRVGRQTRRLRLPADDAVLPLAESSAERVEVFAGTHAYACQRVQRPAWASEIGRDRYGVYLDATIAGVVQRLRWIEPGEFRMGSPPDEPERFNDEGPQHRVRLTRGFWLADTACTQALWQAVMGDNPSHFRDDAHQPVERVSWDDVQRFLAKLRVLLPGAEADLPSEAEWEYACRAGTTTPFSFGETIDTQQANYHGNYPYAGGAQGEYRQTTVPVKTFPANAWGLYEMHGNVWEWCADGLRRYDGAECEDPRGPEGERDSRVVRGGSWDDGGWYVRSAYRSWSGPGDRNHRVGFRLALRSMRGRGAPAPEGQEATAAFAGREGAGAAADAAAPASRRAAGEKKGKSKR